MNTIIAIVICVGLTALVLTPIIKNVIRVEKMDDSKWFYNKKMFNRYDEEVNSKEKENENE